MTKCPYCGYHANQHEEIVNIGNNPKLEDISFCIKCGEISNFTKKGLIKQDINELSGAVLETVLSIREKWSAVALDFSSSKQEENNNGS